ncbi:MAG: response regulator [Bacillota bacterium]|nr:response regulator [Bacillota bacterium]
MKKILIVDDDSTLRFLISETLKLDDENNVFEAADGLEAIRVYDDICPDLVLLDAMMPVMSGFEVAEQIKVKKPKPVIILLTAQAQANINFEISQYGIDHFLSKPFSPINLLQFIEKIFI